MTLIKIFSRATFIITATSHLFWSNAAFAQAQIPAEAAAAVPVEPEASREGRDHISIGLGGAYMPAYQGAEKYRFEPLPAIDIQIGRFFVNLKDGVGANVVAGEGVTVGVGLTPVDGYRSEDVPPGIGKLSIGLGARGFLKLRQFGFEATLGGTKVLTASTEGFLIDASLAYPIRLSDKLTLNPSVSTTYGDQKHNNRYFGVTSQQALRSGLSEFRAESGLVDVRANLGLRYRLTERIGIGVGGGVTTMLGNVKNSPLVDRKTQPYGFGFVSYNF